MSDSRYAPLVGILSVPIDNKMYILNESDNINDYSTYIPLSYVSWLEGGGARIIPIKCNDNILNIKNILLKLNGLLLFSNRNSFCFKKINNIIQFIKHNPIPLWSIDIAFQILLIHTAKTTNIITRNTKNDNNNNNNVIVPNYKALSLNFTVNADDSQLFDSNSINNGYSAIIYTKLWQKQLTVFDINTLNNNIISLSSFNNNQYLIKYFDVLSTNTINKHSSFISLIQTKKYLNLYWIASQFDPSIPQYYQSFNNNNNNNNSFDNYNAVLVNQYFAEFFVNQCRTQNNHSMDIHQYNDKVIYNYNTKLVQIDHNELYEHLYLF